MYEIKIRESGATSWELVTVAQGVTYGRKKIKGITGRTMDGRAHESIIAVKTTVTLTFSKDVTPELVKQLYEVFEHTYVEMLYPDTRTNTMMSREFFLDEELSTKINAWNDNYKRHDAISLVLEER